MKKSGFQAPVDHSLIYASRINLTRLYHTPDDAARTAATARLYELISLACKSKDMANALLDIQKEHGKQIQVYIDVAEEE